MKNFSYIFIFFVFILILPTCVKADQLPNSLPTLYTISGHFILRPSGMDMNHNLGYIYYAFGVTTGSYVATPKYAVYTDITGYMEGFKKIGGDSNDYEFKWVQVKYSFIGPHTNTGSYYGVVWWTGSNGNYGHWSLVSSSTPQQRMTFQLYHYSTLHSGLYYWKIDITFYYVQHPVVGNDIDVYIYKSIEIPFSDVTLLRYYETGNWATDISNGGSLAFSTIWSMWSNTGSKIINLDWGKLMDLDFLGFIGDIITMLEIIGYAMIEMFTVPITSISLIMSYSTNAYTISFFLIELVGIVLISLTLLCVMWKVIILIKP